MNTNTKYLQVVDNIYKILMTSELSGNVGLLAGTSGIALFIAYYDRIILQSNSLNPRVIEILEHNIKCIDSGNRAHSICSGISGFGWLCEHLRKMGMLNQEDVEFLDDLDPFLYNRMMVDIKQGNYDYLHGALGVGTYFLARLEKKDVPTYLHDLLAEVENSGILSENGGIKWISLLDHKTGREGYNISLSHGMSSIAAFLIRLHHLNFEKARVDKLLLGTILYILDQMTSVESNISYFPSHSKESSEGNNYSRLGWCYGDLGIACILRRVAIALKKPEWENTALEVLCHNADRRNIQENLINDAGFCHGSAGIAHVFLNLYLSTRVEKFKETVDYWLHITLQMAKHPDGLAGFKAWHSEGQRGFENVDSFLEGIAGIGMVLLSYLKNDEILWDECVMLS